MKNQLCLSKLALSAIFVIQTLNCAKGETGQESRDPYSPARVAAMLSKANNGDPESQFLLGVMYAEGSGTKVDTAAAAAWYRKAAIKGYARAQCNLGVLYLNGAGVPKEEEEGLSWLRTAADQDNVDAMLAIGAIYINGTGVVRDVPKALEWYHKATDRGSWLASYVIGMAYMGGEGVQQDKPEAVKWLKKAAKSGYPAAQYELGMIYLNGDGVPKDNSQAVIWLRTASVLDYPKANAALRGVYESIAAEELVPIAKTGDSEAQFVLGKRFFTGSAVPRDPVQGFEWISNAAHQGHAQAQYALGVMYFNGSGVPKNLSLASKWLRLAAKQGVEPAEKALETIHVPEFQPPFGETVFEIKDLDQTPTVTVQTPPKYPFDLERRGETGWVVVDFIVDQAGNVQNPFAIKSSNDLFDRGAVEAVAKWKYKPGRKNGRPEVSHMEVPIVFGSN